MQVERMQQPHQNATRAPDLLGTDRARGEEKDGEKGGKVGRRGKERSKPTGAADATPLGPVHCSRSQLVRVDTSCI